jgi:hypothetical protein
MSEKITYFEWEMNFPTTFKNYASCPQKYRGDG